STSNVFFSKKRDDNQWWELFDHNTSRFYYYNATSQKTVWHRPSNCDIIPLAKLQTLKQHAEAVSISSDPEDSSTGNSNNNNNRQHSTPTPAPRETVATQTSGNSVQTAHVTNIKSVNSNSKDSGRSSDSNCSSVQRPAAMVTPVLKKKPLGDVNSASIPTPAPRSIQRSTSNASQQHIPVKQKSFDINISVGGGYSLGHENRCGSMSRTPRPSQTKPTSTTQISRSQSFAQGGAPTHHRGGDSLVPSSHRGESAVSSSYHRGEREEEDSMHEKYFLGGGGGGKKSVESTPQSRRKHFTSSQSQGAVPPTPSTPDYVNFNTPPPPSSYHSRSSSNSSTMQTTVHQTKSIAPPPNSYPYQKSPSIASSKLSSRLKESGLSSSEDEDRSSSLSLSSSPPTAATPPRRVSNMKPSPLGLAPTHLSDTNLDISIQLSRNALTFDSDMLAYRLPCIGTLKQHAEAVSISSDPEDSSTGNSNNNNNRQHSTPTPAPRETVATQTSGNSVQTAHVTNIKSVNSNSKNHVSPTNSKSSSHGNAGPPSHRPLPHHNKNMVTCETQTSPLSPRRSHHHHHHHHHSSNSSRGQVSSTRRGSHQTTKPTQSQKPSFYNFIFNASCSSVLPPGCYRFGDQLTGEEGGRGGEGSLASEDEDGLMRGVGGLRVEYDSDEFADDEAMSNAEEDSSSQEYLDDEPADYLHEEYARRFHAPGSQAWNYTSADGGRMCDYTVVDDGSGASSHYYNTTASLLPPHRMGASNHHQSSTGPLGIPLETQHASLKRKKEPPPPQSTALYSPILEARSEQQMARPMTKDLLLGSGGGGERFTPLPLDSDGGERIYEKYAPDNLNIHKKGIFRKKFTVKAMLSWSTVYQVPDRVPSYEVTRVRIEYHQLAPSSRVSLEIRGPILQTTSSIFNDLVGTIFYFSSSRESLRRGWELMAICLAFFPPSPRLQSYLDSYMNRHRNDHYDFPEVGKWPIHIQVSHYATVACKRLERGGVGGKRQPRKPSVDEIDQARLQIFRPSMFGSTLAEVMSLQRDKFPHHRLPWIQTTLSEQVLRLGGKQTEGIFRVSADMDEVTCLKLQLDRWDLPQSPLLDAHTPASLLKLWYRELYEPLIPDTLYGECVLHCESPSKVLNLVERLPELNYAVNLFCSYCPQMFAKPEVVQQTKMDANNLAMVMAPNCLRCTSADPRIIFDNARKEMAFMRTLIQHLDTSFIEDERVF
ncbi:uncharacterized protein LOC103514939, partial [Diaphorina citri]|uniref:Uncharacterized protein LOC103514939 n=1 Tax=Diaphorina citri TaxID=121845 RepID=A0A3Q0J510_DIACI